MAFLIIQFQFNDAESRWNDGEVIVDAVERSCSHDAWIYLSCRIFVLVIFVFLENKSGHVHSTLRMFLMKRIECSWWCLDKNLSLIKNYKNYYKLFSKSLVYVCDHWIREKEKS